MNLFYQLNLTEDLIIKENKTDDEIHFINELEKYEAGSIFHFSEMNLMSTQNIKAFEYYLKNIAKSLGGMSKDKIELNTIDFYVQTFLANPTILADTRFKNAKFTELITKIQNILLYFYYEYEIEDFFMPCSTEYIFSWAEEDSLNFLETFNYSMQFSFCFNFHDLSKYEEILYKRGAENNIISFLYQCFQKNKNTRSADILINSLRWINQDILLNEEAFSVAAQILSESNNPDFLDLYFTQLMGRALIKEKPPDEPCFPKKLTCKNQVIQHIIEKKILTILYDFISHSNSYKFANEMYFKISKTYITIIQSTPYQLPFIEFLINLIEYASVANIFNLYGLMSFFQLNNSCKDDDNNNNDEIYKNIEMFFPLVFDRIQEISTKETDSDILINKLYGYYLFLMRTMEQKFIDFITNFDFGKNAVILRCSLQAIYKAIKFIPPNAFYPLLNSYISSISATPDFLTDKLLEIYITIYSTGLNYAKSTDQQFKGYTKIFYFLYERVINLTDFPQQTPIVTAFLNIFDVSKFASIINSNNNPQPFIDIILQLINKTPKCYIQCAKKLINMLEKSLYKSMVPLIYDQIVTELDKYDINDNNVLHILEVLALLPSNYIRRNLSIHGLLNKIFTCNSDILLKSTDFIKIITEFHEINSYDIIFDFVSRFPRFNDIYYISLIPTDFIMEKHDQNLIEKALKFGDLIIRFMTQYGKPFIADKQKLNEMNILVNESVNYFIPLLFLMPSDQIQIFCSLVVSAINRFDLKADQIAKFLHFFENPLNEEFVNISWMIFENTKSIFFEGNFEPYLPEFIEIATELLNFQHFMFELDYERAISVLDQITPKSDKYDRFIILMNPLKKSKFSSNIKKFISFIQKNSIDMYDSLSIYKSFHMK